MFLGEGSVVTIKMILTLVLFYFYNIAAKISMLTLNTVK